MGSESIFKVEARAMLEGLFLAWDKCYRKIKVDCDNALLVDLLNSGRGTSNNLVEVRLLHQVLRLNWEVRIQHVQRMLNEVANAMAKQTVLGDLMLQLY